MMKFFCGQNLGVGYHLTKYIMNTDFTATVSGMSCVYIAKLNQNKDYFYSQVV